MLRGFANIVKIPDLRRKVAFTLAIIALYRLGAHVPLPGVDYGALQSFLEAQQQQGGVTQLVSLFTGGALIQMSVFALGIMPYITASIIMQLLKVVIPKIEEWQKEGETGQQKITQWTRYLTVVLAVLQSTAVVVMIRNGGGALFGGNSIPGLMPNPSIGLMLLMILTLTAGTAFIMWLGELITEKGIGNGMSLIIFAAVVSRMPGLGVQVFAGKGTVGLALVLLTGVLLVFAVVFVELGQRRIPVQYAKRTVGRRTYGGTETYIPLKVNQAGVIPIIFASSLLFLPNLVSSISSSVTVTRFVNQYLQQNDPVFILLYIAMTIFFAFFYTAITFNPTDVADNMKKFGGFIPGIRPGRPTAEYIDHVLTRITTAGSLYLGAIAALPFVVFALFGIPFIFGGAVLLIAVGVMLNTLQQIESQLMQRHYEGFLRS
jgi:preprotein translocase subunit SecY